MNNTSEKVDFDTELKTTRHLELKALVSQFKAISAEAKNLCNRQNRPYEKLVQKAWLNSRDN